MGKITSSAIDKTEEDSLTGRLADVLANVSLTTEPVVVCGVQRKANLGNFETLDVYCAVVLPVSVKDSMDDVLRQAIAETTEIGFDIASRETGIRYQLIKASAKEKPPSQ